MKAVKSRVLNSKKIKNCHVSNHVSNSSK